MRLVALIAAAALIGLGAAARYLAAHDMRDVHAYVQALHALAVKALGEIPGVHLYTAPSRNNIGITAFTVDGVHPHDVAEVAAHRDVAVRAGHHCAMPIHTALGLSATVRASFFLYNTKADVDKLADVVRESRAVFRLG